MMVISLAAIFPVVQKQHQLLVTLLLCNAVAMEVYSLTQSFLLFFWFLQLTYGELIGQGLPIYLDKLFNEYVAIILSVTFVLAFGEVCIVLHI